MKRNVIISAALLSAAIAGSVPMTTQAANIKVMRIQDGNICNVYRGDDLQKALEKICNNTGNIGNFCPDVQGPGTSTPEQPNWPGIQQPAPEQPGPGESDGVVHSEVEQVVNLVNAERAKAGLPALQMQTGINNAAAVRAQEIKRQFSHTRPDGSSFSTALTQQGVSYNRSGENIAYGQRTPEAVMEGWMNSSGHRANILNASFQNIGVGLYQDENGVKHWVQLFT